MVYLNALIPSGFQRVVNSLLLAAVYL